jgi:hypothetical protein
VAELIRWYDDKDDDEHQAVQEFTNFANECYSAHPNNSVCLSCSARCADGFQLSSKSVNTGNNKALVKEAVKNPASKK